MGVASIVLKALLSVSVSAGLFAVAIIGFRLVCGNRLRRFRMILWGILALRLMIPISIETPFGLIPEVKVSVKEDAAQSGIASHVEAEQKLASLSVQNGVVRQVVRQDIWTIATIVWMVGVSLLVAYFLFRQFQVARIVKHARKKEDNVFYLSKGGNAFVFGLFRPRIYLPEGLDLGTERFVIQHEKTHIDYGDHIVKPIAFLLLATYWFHPVLWLSYFLLCRDIEYACDERVIQRLSPEAKLDYAEAILSFTSITRTPHSIASFGTVPAKKRINVVLNYKKPGLWLIFIAVVALIAGSILLFSKPTTNQRTIELQKAAPELFSLDASEGLNIHVGMTAQDNYYCIITSGKEQEYPISGKGLSVEDIELILASYNLLEEKIVLHATRFPWSDYAYRTEMVREKLNGLFKGKYIVGSDSKMKTD
ncbi:MAG: M56 family metallopeptidase [Lachnospiraceae bacterium]|nr:M56 family metallopeptidase [Lachnospiraceae bacterium]